MSAQSAELELGAKPMVKYDSNGLVPAIVQDAASGQVLMMAWMNDQALRQTILKRKATFYSRSRKAFWTKGESSGHFQEVVEIRTDCDQDVILLKVKSHGPACHVGFNTCFYRRWDLDGGELAIVEPKAYDPEQVYKK
jgi:phosphoribosyl-AMP cyclohydrolase